MSNYTSKLKSDLAEILFACCDGKLKDIKIEWHDKKSLCIVLCSKGYPDAYKKNIEIKNMKKINLNKNEFIFHAGTEKKNEKIFAIGGRVLNFVALADNFNDAKISLLANLKKLDWRKGFFRKDIGHKVIQK